VDPNGARALTGEALSLLLQNRIDAALDAANRAVKAQPDFAAVHAVKGCALLKNGNRLVAAAEFKQAANDTSGQPSLVPWQRLLMEQLDCRLDR
jgi:Flp pilus assembly protein TadD